MQNNEPNELKIITYNSAYSIREYLKNNRRQKQKYITKDLDSTHILYLTDQHVLANEICEKLNIHIANISNLKSDTILKLGNCPILNKLDSTLPFGILNEINTETYTSLEGKIPLNHFRTEYNLNTDEIKEFIAERFETISSKVFLVYKQEFLNRIIRRGYDRSMYVMNRAELYEILSLYDDIEYIKINNNKYIIFY